MSIRSRIGWSFTALAVTLLLALAGIMYESSRSTVTEQVVRHLSSVAAIQEQRIETLVERNLERVALVASRTQLRLSLRDLHGAPPEARGPHLERLRRILTDALESIHGFARLAILAPDGTPVLSVERDAEDRQPGIPASLAREAPRRPVLVGFHLSGRRRPMLRLAGPLTLAGALEGVLVADVFPSRLLQTVRDYTGLGSSGETILVFRDQSGAARYVTPLRFAGGAALTPVELRTDRDPPPALLALQGVEEVLEDATDYRGAAVLAVTRHLERFGLGITVKLDRAEAYAPVRRMGLVALLLTVVAVGLVIGLSHALARSIARPLRSLTDAAVRISEGERAPRTEAGRDDEVRVLAEAFDRMARHLIDLNTSLEEQVARRTAELRESNHALEAYSYSVSHDLRAPLRGIRQWGEALIEDHGPELAPEAREYAERIIASARRMDTLAGDLLAYSRATAAELTLSAVSLSAVVRDVLDQLQPHLQERGALVLSEEPLPRVIGHSGALFPVIENLVVNAAKYVAPGVRPRIVVRAERRGDHVRLWVEDNGIGVPRADQARIFEPFERVGSPGTSGTGVGLAIVRRSIERMGGTVGVESEPGRGSRFWFELPAAPPLALAG